MDKQCFCSEIDPGSDRAAQIFPVFCERVEGGGGAKIDHTRRSAIHIHDCHSIRNAVGSHRLGVLITDLDSGFDSHIHHEGIFFQVFPASLDHASRQLGHDGGKTDCFKIFDGKPGVL